MPLLGTVRFNKQTELLRRMQQEQGEGGRVRLSVQGCKLQVIWNLEPKSIAMRYPKCREWMDGGGHTPCDESSLNLPLLAGIKLRVRLAYIRNIEPAQFWGFPSKNKPLSLGKWLRQCREYPPHVFLVDGLPEWCLKSTMVLESHSSSLSLLSVQYSSCWGQNGPEQQYEVSA